LKQVLKFKLLWNIVVRIKGSFSIRKVFRNFQMYWSRECNGVDNYMHYITIIMLRNVELFNFFYWVALACWDFTILSWKNLVRSGICKCKMWRMKLKSIVSIQGVFQVMHYLIIFWFKQWLFDKYKFYVARQTVYY